MQESWHSFPIEKAFKELNSGLRGLSREQVQKRLAKYGPNQLPQEKPFSEIRLFLEQVKSPLVYILFIAGVVTLGLRDYTDGIIIFAAVLLNTIVGYLQESKASHALLELKKILQLKAVVIRNGQEEEILQKDLVPGDVVRLRGGNKVPADLRIIEAHDLKINESTLTGEWLAAEKNTKILPAGRPLADRDNMAYLGTSIESGWGKGLVIGTGSQTEIGRVAEAVKKTTEEKTPYQKKLARFSKILGIVILVISLLIFIEGMLTGGRFVEIFTTSIAVAVAAVPEGLPIAMTVVLALGMQRILKRKGLVRKLASAETLGSTSIILTDKTGTLTEAKMAVAGILVGENMLLDNGSFDFKPEEDDKHARTSRQLALKIAMLCNDSFIENIKEPTEKWIIRGAPTEKSLFLAALSAGFSRKKLERELPVIDRLLFDASYQYAMSLHKLNSENNVLYAVGSPEKILNMSAYLEENGQTKKLLLSDFKKIKERYEKLTKDGFRLIAVGYRKTNKERIDGEKEEKLRKMVLVGFFALHDPIRKKSKEIIDICRHAGMRPIIVTGDHKYTALAVANKLGFGANKQNVLEGRELAQMDDKEFQKRIKNIQIYARVEPIQKLRIVEAWQKQGGVVAMTGDGINDAPALKKADIGVALGSGTDVAKEVSDLVLLTDNFSVIEAAVEEGRAIIDNIRKIITYLLSDSFTEVILVGFCLMLGWPLPVLAAQILWVNLIEDGPLSICLAFEKKEKDIMKRQPADYGLFLLTREMKVLIFIIGLVSDFLLLGLFFFLFKYTDYSLVHIRSVIFAGLTIDSLFYIFACKSLRRGIFHINIFSNRFLIYAWLLGITMLLVALYTPFLQGILRTVPLNFFDWGVILFLGFLEIFLIELTKHHYIVKKQFR